MGFSIFRNKSNLFGGTGRGHSNVHILWRPSETRNAVASVCLANVAKHYITGKWVGEERRRIRLDRWRLVLSRLEET